MEKMKKEREGGYEENRNSNEYDIKRKIIVTKWTRGRFDEI